MHFTKEFIRNLDSTQFSAEDKKYLIEKFCMKSPSAPWKEQLAIEWRRAKRWNAYLRPPERPNHLPRYRYTHENIVRLAKYATNRPVGWNRVTDFTGWIYSFYLPPPERSSLDMGKHVEREIAKELEMPPQHKDWQLMFQDPPMERAEPFKISGLQVDKQPMWGIPDLVFREKRTGRVLVIERKASNADVPSDGWPNLRAQLWAYGHIDDWADAPEVLLVGEIWGFGYLGTRIRHTYCWRLSDERFCSENKELFEIYSALPTSGNGEK